MAFSIVTFTTALKALFDENNTTTSSYDLSTTLKKRVQSVKVGYHGDKPITNISYPIVWIEPRNSASDFAVSGPTAKRDITLNIDLVGITQVGLGYENGRETSDREMLQLSTNIENLIRNYPQLSNTSQVMQALVTGAEYDIMESSDTYNSIAKLNLEVKLRST